MTQKIQIAQPYLGTVLSTANHVYKTPAIVNVAFPQPSNPFLSGAIAAPSLYSSVDTVIEITAISGSSAAVDVQLYGSNDLVDWIAIGSAAADNTTVSTVVLANTLCDYQFLSVWSTTDNTTTPSITLNITLFGSVQKIQLANEGALALSVASSTIKGAIFRNVGFPQVANSFLSGEKAVESVYSSIDTVINCHAIAGVSAAFTAQLFGCNDGLDASMSAIGSATASITAAGETLLQNVAVDFSFLQVRYVMSATTTPTATVYEASYGF